MLADGPHLGSDRAGDREPLGVERLEEPSDGLGEVLALPPRLPSLHPGQVQERNPHVVLRVEVRNRDGEEIGPGDEAVAEELAADRQPMIACARWDGRRVNLLADVRDLHLRRTGLATGRHRGPPGDDRNLQLALGELLRKVERSEREMAAYHHHLPGPDMRRGGVEHGAMAVRRKRDEDRIGAVDRLAAARRNPRAELSLERSCGDKRRRPRRDRACAGRRATRGSGSCPRLGTDRRRRQRRSPRRQELRPASSLPQVE